MRKFSVLLAMVALLLVSIGAVGAIPFGNPDGEAHPYVGLAVFDDADGPAWRCSGTLISETVFLTAGHCTSGAVAARVWFESNVDTVSDYPFGGGTAIEGTPYTHPGFDNFATFPNTSDIGVIVLNQSVTNRGYGTLPGLSYLDTLDTARGKKDVVFDVVGYGLQSVKPTLQADRIRMIGNVHLINLRSALTDGYNVQVSNNPGQGNGGPGGTCFGDSGGPMFIHGTTVIVSVTSFGLNANCAGVGFNYRLDISNSLDWLTGFLD
jgi:hypothetical protein